MLSFANNQLNGVYQLNGSCARLEFLEVFFNYLFDEALHERNRSYLPDSHFRGHIP